MGIRLGENRLVFWDFDGVIKESVEVKTQAYVNIFRQFGDEQAVRVSLHHEANGGMSRFEKIPLYLSWVKPIVTIADIDMYCSRFAENVVNSVISSSWVPGAREYLEANWQRQVFVLVTATPQSEIEYILRELGIDEWFDQVHGAPSLKFNIVAAILHELDVEPKDCIYIGDSKTDKEAAESNKVEFILRCTPLNVDIQKTYRGRQCKDFENE
jgi:phosphoglycolate phosphatase-like HAD superfamily hydrolase